jgi:hypothetical protein
MERRTHRDRYMAYPMPGRKAEAAVFVVILLAVLFILALVFSGHVG